MSPLRVLGLAYLASASVFAMAAVCAAHPLLAPFIKHRAEIVARSFRETVWRPALDFARAEQAAIFYGPTPIHRVTITPPQPGELRTAAHATVPSIAARKLTQQAGPQFVTRADDIVLPDLSADGISPGASRVARSTTVAPPSVAQNVSSPESQRDAMRRLKVSLTPEMLKSFDLFVYVSKAESGPLAQRMYVFRKQQEDVLELAYDWAASTGREQNEITPLGNPAFTDTPNGYYEFDPDRMYRRYHSHAWNQPMPHTMFFNWEREGLATGLAIHGASGGDIAKLGQRASAGCVHIAPENAALLYGLIRRNYKGEVPRFSYDKRTHTMSNNGNFLRDAKGNLSMAGGYKVLIYIENYGGKNVVAALF